YPGRRGALDTLASASGRRARCLLREAARRRARIPDHARTIPRPGSRGAGQRREAGKLAAEAVATAIAAAAAIGLPNARVEAPDVAPRRLPGNHDPTSQVITEGYPPFLVG